MNLLEHFGTLRKAQLQEYFLRWFPGETMTSDKDALVERLHVAMQDPRTVRRRFDRLSRSAQDFVVSVMVRPGYRATFDEIRQNPRGRGIEPYEVENLVKNLTCEGWIIPVSEATNGIRRDVFILPEEIGDGLAATVDIEFREAPVMLGLKAFLGKDGADGGELEALVDPAAIEERIAALHADLRDVVEDAIARRGGILALSEWRREGHTGSLNRKEWRQALEAGRLGTTGVLSLKAFGIELEEECLVVSQEIVEAVRRRAIAEAKVENDREYSLGIDLLIDIRRLLEVARGESIEVTREGSVFKKTEEGLEAQLLTSHYRELFEASPVQHVLGLCKKLRLLDKGDRFLRTDPIRRKLWLKKQISTMIRSIFEVYESEHRENRWSFHQRFLRQILITELAGLAPGTWAPARALLDVCVARFLCGLGDLGVARTFRDLQMEELHNETLMASPDRLFHDLSHWVVHRLALAGIVNLGFREGKFHSIQVSSLGCRLFKIEQSATEEGRLVVNPDFEILLFPGGKHREELNYTLSAFADRTASEWVKRYRITPASVKRGVIAGYASSAILEFLEKHSENPLPPNVRFSIKEWADGIEPILRQRVLLLKAVTRDGADRVEKILKDRDVPHERIGERALAVRGVKNERKIRDLGDLFQNEGFILE